MVNSTEMRIKIHINMNIFYKISKKFITFLHCYIYTNFYSITTGKHYLKIGFGKGKQRFFIQHKQVVFV